MIYTAIFACDMWEKELQYFFTYYETKKNPTQISKSPNDVNRRDICVKIKLGKLEQQKYYKREKRKAGDREKTIMFKVPVAVTECYL